MYEKHFGGSVWKMLFLFLVDHNNEMKRLSRYKRSQYLWGPNYEAAEYNRDTLNMIS